MDDERDAIAQRKEEMLNAQRKLAEQKLKQKAELEKMRAADLERAKRE